MKKTNKTPLAAAMSTAVVSVFTATAANAEANPFAMTELSDGYMQVAESDTTSGYTVKPWGGKKTKKANEASCGEGRCGAMMDGDKMKKGQENSCGAMMKGNEGSCGSMNKDADKPAMDMSSGSMDMKGGEMSCGAMMEKMKSGEMSCGAMMEKMKGKMGGMDMKGGEMSCGSKVDPAKAAGE
jgi:uncharacterized low-complexity protein